MCDGERRGKKRNKSFYKKSAYGGKRSRTGANILEAGIRGFLVMCNNNESNAVKETYNILNQYADVLCGPEQIVGKMNSAELNEEDSDCDDVEKAVKKEVDGMKNKKSTQRRFQNVHTKAKNCVFIRTTLEDPVRLVVHIMEDIAQQKVAKARYAARILPVLGTCKAHTSDIEKLAADVLPGIFLADSPYCPSSYTIIFKARNNNGSTCGKMSVVPAVRKVVSTINPAVRFCWSEFELAILVEVVCTVCCLGAAPGYIKLRKYNMQELLQGSRSVGDKSVDVVPGDGSSEVRVDSDVVPEDGSSEVGVSSDVVPGDGSSEVRVDSDVVPEDGSSEVGVSSDVVPGDGSSEVGVDSGDGIESVTEATAVKTCDDDDILTQSASVKACGIDTVTEDAEVKSCDIETITKDAKVKAIDNVTEDAEVKSGEIDDDKIR